MNEPKIEVKPEPTKKTEPGFWGKADILLKPIGGLATASVIAFIGYLGSDVLQERQQTNARVQLYAQIMSSREEAETGLRREMFKSIIETFLQPRPGAKTDAPDLELKKRLLAVQLLTYNFHDALDIGPLFKYMEQEAIRIHANSPQDLESTLKGLKRTAKDVIAKQVAVLESDGETKSALFELSYGENGIGKPWINDDLPELTESTTEVDTRSLWSRFWPDEESDSSEMQIEINELTPMNFRLEILGWKKQAEEVKVRLIVRNPETSEAEFDEIFWVGFFDFPLIDNTRLGSGERCAVVLEKFTIDDPPEKNEKGDLIYGEVELNLIYFPGSRASLKSRPYYEEIIGRAIGK